MAVKVLMYGWELPPYNSGGLGVACLGLGRALTNNGVDLTFVLPKISDSSVKYPFKVIEAGVKDYKFYSAYKNMAYKKSAGQYQQASWPLLNVVRHYAYLAGNLALTNDYDVIHAHDWLTFGAGIRAKQLTGKPLVAHVHATEFDRSGEQGLNSTVFAIEKQGLLAANKVVPVSNHTKSIIADKYGIKPKKFTVVHNGLDTTEFRKGHKIPLGLKKLGFKIVLYVGRITYQKGPEYFLNAARKVLETNKKVIFIVAGSGDQYEQMIEKAAEMGISANLFFAGFVRGVQQYTLFKEADLLVMPSVSEPFGLVALESLYFKTPVIVSKTSGVGEVLPNCIKVDFWDTDRLAANINLILQNPAFSYLLGTYGNKEALEQTWDKAAVKCIQIYKELGTGY